MLQTTNSWSHQILKLACSKSSSYWVLKIAGFSHCWTLKIARSSSHWMLKIYADEATSKGRQSKISIVRTKSKEPTKRTITSYTRLSFSRHRDKVDSNKRTSMERRGITKEIKVKENQIRYQSSIVTSHF